MGEDSGTARKGLYGGERVIWVGGKSGGVRDEGREIEGRRSAVDVSRAGGGGMEGGKKGTVGGGGSGMQIEEVR